MPEGGGHDNRGTGGGTKTFCYERTLIIALTATGFGGKSLSLRLERKNCFHPDETVQDDKQPHGVDCLPHSSHGLLHDHRADRQFLGLPRVHHHRLQAGGRTPTRRTVLHAGGQLVLAVCLGRVGGGEDGELHERADERGVHLVPVLEHHAPGAQAGGDG